jgi:hypothetical protein
MAAPSQGPRESPISQFWRDEAYLRQEFSRIRTVGLLPEALDGKSRLEALLAREVARGAEARTARTKIAASEVTLPITAEMAWAVPQLLKRVRLVSPGVLSTSGALRSLIRMPQWDDHFTRAFTDSGFLWCDRAVERALWKYDLKEMIARQLEGSAWEVLEHCSQLLAQHRTKHPVDWNATLADLQALVSWFPEVRTLHLLEQLYGRLHLLHMKGMLVVQCWLDWRAGTADTIPAIPTR